MYRLTPFVCVLALASSCVAYVADDADVAKIAAEVHARRGGRFTFAAAVATACRQNPELRALAARARAAGADLEPLALESEYRSGPDTLAVMLDPVALLNFGPRAGQNRLLDAEADAAVVALATRRWQIAAALAEVFAVDATLADLAVPQVTADADAFERAGLASPLAAAQVRAARAGAIAEQAMLRAEFERNRAALRRLLALPDDATVDLVATPTPEPVRDDAVLLQRPDLALATARFRVADAEYRAAVAAQYPALTLGPEFSLRGGPLDVMALLRLPLGAWGKATAAGDRREAARADLEAAFAAVQQEVRDAAAEFAAATASADAARAAFAASARRLAAAMAAIEVDVDAFGEVADAAVMAVRDAMEHRRAEVTRQRLRVRRDVAYGWPAVGEAGS